jgi:hypothetical protein
MIGMIFTVALAILGVAAFALIARRRDNAVEADYFAPVLTQSPSRYGTETAKGDRVLPVRMHTLDLEQIRAAGL